MDRAEQFTEFRPLLFSIAYRMLGSVMDAEDMVQETYLRWQAADAGVIASPKAYLTTIVSRLCIDHLRSARVRREEYVGPWLPEPLVADPSPSIGDQVMMAESLTNAFLVLLENLSPTERAVFLLREVFDYDYAEVAQIAGKSEAACRQIVSRARKRITDERPRFEVASDEGVRVAEEFVSAVMQGDMDAVMAVLDEDVTWWSDGDGMHGVARKPVRGAELVARFAINLTRLSPPNATQRFALINAQPGLIVYVEGKVYTTMTIEVVKGRVVGVRAVVNPAKLRHLPPLEE